MDAKRTAKEIYDILGGKEKDGPTEPMNGMCAEAETREILRSKAMSCGLRSNS